MRGVSQSRLSAATIALAVVLLANSAVAQSRYKDRPLVDVLRELQAAGVKVIYSSELVRPDMRVTAEPRARSPRRILDELLNPHGLQIRNGPNGTLLVVRGADSGPVVVAAGDISGRVLDAKTGAPLEGVLVEVQASGHTTRTDSEGNFVLAGV